MALADEDILFIKQHLGEWLAEQSLGKPPAVYEIELREGFAQVDKRLDQVDKRFEMVDSRFDEMLRRNDRHFLWLVGFIASSAGLIVAAMRFL